MLVPDILLGFEIELQEFRSKVDFESLSLGHIYIQSKIDLAITGCKTKTLLLNLHLHSLIMYLINSP